ncbi:hypothetical protein ACFV2H_11765 [Streptomyces sp. NPDC059629]|uniref:hypothetical protein n=1 Tax=Streptomyces sp. NPDC059629 TaxID=3346889 RepID=UPI0036C914D3
MTQGARARFFGTALLLRADWIGKAAAITVARAKRYSHLPFPPVYAAPVAGALVLGLMS